jgi:hypothetical protein
MIGKQSELRVEVFLVGVGLCGEEFLGTQPYPEAMRHVFLLERRAEHIWGDRTGLRRDHYKLGRSSAAPEESSRRGKLTLHPFEAQSNSLTGRRVERQKSMDTHPNCEVWSLYLLFNQLYR